ncbi:MAG TPA: hypothetical protein VJT77_11220 [Burkholderiales bacterium]|nr:hypothetical protein [Burkholderiales bacterium]
MTRTVVLRQNRAELAGATGAGVLGVGLGALLAQWTAQYAVPLLIVGVLLHGWGMLEKQRLEAGVDVPLWSTALYWACWAVLAVLIVWIVVKAWG